MALLRCSCLALGGALVYATASRQDVLLEPERPAAPAKPPSPVPESSREMGGATEVAQLAQKLQRCHHTASDKGQRSQHRELEDDEESLTSCMWRAPRPASTDSSDLSLELGEDLTICRLGGREKALFGQSEGRPITELMRAIDAQALEHLASQVASTSSSKVLQATLLLPGGPAKVPLTLSVRCDAKPGFQLSTSSLHIIKQQQQSQQPRLANLDCLFGVVAEPLPDSAANSPTERRRTLTVVHTDSLGSLDFSVSDCGDERATADAEAQTEWRLGPGRALQDAASQTTEKWYANHAHGPLSLVSDANASSPRRSASLVKPPRLPASPLAGGAGRARSESPTARRGRSGSSESARASSERGEIRRHSSSSRRPQVQPRLCRLAAVEVGCRAMLGRQNSPRSTAVGCSSPASRAEVARMKFRNGCGRSRSMAAAVSTERAHPSCWTRCRMAAR